MADRLDLAKAFLNRTDWASAHSSLLAGDASNRKYFRLTLPTQETAVLMDAPPDKGEDTRPFVAIAEYLGGLGLSAPRILAADDEAGFLLLEDLGDALFARVMIQDPALEQNLYEVATDVLVELHGHAPPAGLATYDPDIMADMAALAFDWYATGADAPAQAARDQAHRMLREILTMVAPDAPVLIQRDYHAENLLWLPEREGIARVGLLDFQDAMRGHKAYDLVSLLQDARRDVPPAIETEIIDRYLAATGMNPEDFRTAYFVLGAQRNLRILGVFARLCLRDGKQGYIDLIPRVWSYLERDLAHPALAGLNTLIKHALPAPDPDKLRKLKEKCATIPAL